MSLSMSLPGAHASPPPERRARVDAWALVLAFITGVCGSASCGDPGPGGGGDAAPPEAPRFLTALASAADLASLSMGPGGEVKYLAPVDGRSPSPPLTATCYFQNMRRFSWHVGFLQSFPEYAGLSYDAYLGLVVRGSRRLWGGAIKPWSGASHPGSGAPGVVAYTVYGESGDLDVAGIVEVDRRLKGCAPFAADVFVFVPEGVEQQDLLLRERQRLAGQGVAALFPEDLMRGVHHLAHSPGEGYGTLRLIPRGQPLGLHGPRDVIVVESAPGDLSAVAGLLTRDPQDALGPVNLRLQEQGIPSATVPLVYEAAWVRALDGQLVHLQVSPHRFALEPAALADAQAFWDRGPR
jgi:pyruvate, water dikinase